MAMRTVGSGDPPEWLNRGTQPVSDNITTIDKGSRQRGATVVPNIIPAFISRAGLKRLQEKCKPLNFFAAHGHFATITT